MRDGNQIKFMQRSMLYPELEWEISQVKHSVDPDHPDYNNQAAYAKLQERADGSCAHGPESMDCAACHTSWMTSCFGCHLPQEANWRTDMHHFERKKLRNWASYNPQVARDDVFMLGVSPDVKDNKVAVVRSSSAVMVSSTDATRGIAYKQQLTVAANGMSGQCFNTHFAHTVRKTETRKCSDCHLSDRNDNNAWLAQTYLQGNELRQLLWYVCLRRHRRRRTRSGQDHRVVGTAGNHWLQPAPAGVSGRSMPITRRVKVD